MTKRILSMVLVLAMVLSLVPAVVLAEGTDTVVASPKAGTHTDAGHSDDCGVTEGWEPWPGTEGTADTLPTSGQYYLESDITLSAQVEMTGDLTLCLNGYVIKQTATTRIIGTAKNNIASTLTITDCTAYEEGDLYYAGALTGGKMKGTDGGGAIFVRPNGTLKIYDGRITGNTYQNDTATGGGAIMVRATTGGYHGEVYIYGGEFTNNRSVKANGTSNQQGGAITFGNGSVFEITGGVFRDNSASNGGALFCGSGTGLIRNATFTENNASFSGSAIHVNSGLQLTIGDGTVITGNTGTNTNANEGYSAAVVMGSSSCKLTLTGKVYIANNKTNATGITSLAFNKAATDTLYVNELAAGSYVEFSTPKTVPADADEVIALNGAQSSWSNGWVAFMDKEGSLQYIGYENGDFKFVDAHVHTVCSDTGCTDHTDRVVYEPWGDDPEEEGKLPTEGDWYLTKDVTVSAEVKLSKADTLNLCLNGKTITGFSANGARAYSTTAKVATTINISDCQAKTEEGVYTAGKITGFTNTHTDSGGAGIYIREGSTLNFYDGIIENCVSATGGAAIYIHTATANIYGGLITNNQAISGTTLKHGGGLFLYKSNLTMYGGEISHNEANQGGGIYLRDSTATICGGKITGNEAAWGGGVAFYNGNNTLDMQGGQITDNTASGNGGGVQGAYGTAIIKFSGDAIVTGNKLTSGAANNVRLGGSASVTVGQLGPNAKVGITATADRAISNALTSDLSAQFPSDDTTYVTYLNADGKLALKENTTPTPPPADAHAHTLCNDTGCTEHTGIVEYQAWTDATSLPSEGNWYLTKDVTVSAEVKLSKADTLNLCLNGKTITGFSANSARAYSTTANTATTINVSDCTAKTENGVYTAGKFTGFTNTHTDSGGAAIYIRAGSTLNFFDGIIEKNAAASGGGGIYVHTATANIWGGLITGNKAISGSTWKSGGGIFLYKATLTIYDGEISGNEAGLGAGIYMGDSTSVVDIRGGKITGNTAQSNSGGLHAAYSAATVKLSGDPIITGNTLASGAANNVRLGNTGKLTIGQLGANAQIGITASSGRALSNVLTSDLSAQFPSDDATYTTYLNADSQLQMKSSFQHVHCECGKTDCTDTTHKQVEYEAWTNPNELPNAGNYCLQTDVKLSAESKVSTELNLCLHGNTITGPTGSNGRILSTAGNAGAVIRIADCTAKTVDGVYTAGKLTGSKNTSTGSGGGAIFVRPGDTMYLYDAIISDNVAYGYGGGIMVTGTLYMYGGLITGNKTYRVANGETTWLNGGGIFMNTNSGVSGKLYMYGGEISGNEALNGGGIFMSTDTVVQISGGKVIDNIAHNAGAGIQGTSNGSTITLSGDVTITGNKLTSGKANNVNLGGSKVMEVGTMGENASVGITATAFRAISTKTSDYTKNFISDDTKLTVIYQDEVLYMGANSDHKHCLCSGTTSTGCDHSKLTYAEWDDATSLPTAGNYYLSVDVTVSKQASLSSQLNLCLNGHTVKVGDQGGRAYYMTNGGKLNLSDCAGSGKITGATAGAILTNKDGKDMQLNLYGGSFTGNHSNGSGGALVIQGECTFNMYGGKITGNSATGYLKLDDNGKPILDGDGDQDYQSCNGGGLYTGSGTTFNMYGGEISGNKATEVEYLKAGATSTSKAGGIGGGVAIYGTANLYGGKVSGNTGYTGGGIFVTGTNSVLNLLGTEVSGNTALHGGGIISQTKSVVNMKAGKVTGNTTTGSGAGMYVSTGTTLNLTGGEFSGNVAAANGGGVYVLSAVVNLDGGAIKDNKANNGAGMYASATVSGGAARAATIYVNEGALITGNYASTNGGGIMMSGHSTMTAGEGSKIIMTGGEISKNQGKNAGGILTQTKSAMELSGGKIVNNTAYNGGGGGVYISTGTKLTMTGGSVNSNIATKNDGGGMYLLRSTAELKGGSISYNTAANAGGLKIGGAKVTISGTSFVGNKAVGKTTVDATTGESKTTGGNAGGIMIGRAGYKKDGVQYYDTPVVNVYSMYVADSTSYSSGAGVLVQSQGTIFNMYGGTVTGNSTENGSGGGIYFSSNTINTVTGGTVSNNKAKNAGGMYFLNNTSNVSGLKVYGNEASNASGGFTISGKTTTVNMKNMEVYDNTAGGAAGAMVIQSYATLNLEDSKIYGNTSGSTAGAIYFSNPGYGNLKNVELYENQSLKKEAGAVFVGTNSIVKLDNVTVRDNKAGGDYGGGIYNRGRLEITNSKVLNNETAGYGGGIGSFKVASTLLADSAGVFAENVIISGNKAGLQGGGVYAHRGCPTYLTDCTITDNTAGGEGGGIFADGRMGLTNVTVTGNTSGGEGFAVYLTPSEFDGHSYQTGHKRISGNMIIKDNQGGDMYLGEGTALAVTGETLGEKSHVNITLHSGVLSQWVFGVYGYEGGDQVYTLTTGDRSITDPEPIPAAAEAEAEEDKTAESGDTILYIGIGIFVLAIVAVIILLLTKKKKAGNAATEATKE